VKRRLDFFNGVNRAVARPLSRGARFSAWLGAAKKPRNFVERRCVADRPIRCNRRLEWPISSRRAVSRNASSRSSDSARCAPRLLGTSA
jgi:hypothetical protein